MRNFVAETKATMAGLRNSVAKNTAMVLLGIAATAFSFAVVGIVYLAASL